MLPVVAVEALLFMGRRDLDKMCAISKRLDALMDVACATYPFRRLRRVHLRTSASMFHVIIVENEGWFETFDEALTYLSPFFRCSYVDEFEVGLYLFDGNYRVSPRQWADLTQIFSSGAVRHLLFVYVDLSALDDSAFVDAVRCRELGVSWCGVRGKLLSDDVLRSCAASGVIDLHVCANKSGGEHTVSEEALMDFCFPPNGPTRAVSFDNLATTSDTFALKFIERLLATACTSRPSGYIVFTSKTEQSGLADYVQHLVPAQANPTYCFASLRKGDLAYHFVIEYHNREDPNPAYRNSMEFSFGYMDLRPTKDDRQDDGGEEDTETE